MEQSSGTVHVASCAARLIGLRLVFATRTVVARMRSSASAEFSGGAAGAKVRAMANLLLASCTWHTSAGISTRATSVLMPSATTVVAALARTLAGFILVTRLHAHLALHKPFHVSIATCAAVGAAVRPSHALVRASKASPALTRCCETAAVVVEAGRTVVDACLACVGTGRILVLTACAV